MFFLFFPFFVFFPGQSAASTSKEEAMEEIMSILNDGLVEGQVLDRRVEKAFLALIYGSETPTPDDLAEGAEPEEALGKATCTVTDIRVKKTNCTRECHCQEICYNGPCKLYCDGCQYPCWKAIEEYEYTAAGVHRVKTWNVETYISKKEAKGYPPKDYRQLGRSWSCYFPKSDPNTIVNERPLWHLKYEDLGLPIVILNEEDSCVPGAEGEGCGGSP